MTPTSSQILDNWEDGIHYCGDIDDLIDALMEEEDEQLDGTWED